MSTNQELKQWRGRLGLSMSAMAQFVGVPLSTYDKWEKGLREPPAVAGSLFDLLRMAEVVSPDLFNARLDNATKGVSNA